ncbi:MAG: hypothetical protein JWP76_1168 [Dactylosporangium sp.]|nr:hypothetical protein [Dactylosporangium sp.]
MPTRLLLEGNDIQQLLARVRAEHGPAAKIVSADRVRAAGVGGLFTRHRFELTIEVADGSATGKPGLPSTASTKPASPASAASPADALVALVEAQERKLLPYLGPDESASADNAMQAAQEVSAGAAAFADVLAGYAAPAWVPLVPGDAPTAVEATAPADATPVTAAPAIELPVTELPVTELPVTELPAVTPPATPAAPLIPRYQPGRLPTYSSVSTVLTRLGLPTQLAELVTGFDSYREIVRVVKLLPDAPKVTRDGEVLVIAGELHRALEVARTVAESLDLPPTRIALAAASCKGTGIHPSRRMKGPEYTARRIARLRRKADLPIVVVVDVPTDGSGTERARSIIESCDAAAIWGVTDATRKTADSARRLADIGRVDAIAAYGCAETDDPATVLQLGIPVAMIDARVATPRLWAELLCRRLEEVVE